MAVNHGMTGRMGGHRDAVRAFLLLGGVVFAASIVGLASAHGFSVSFWPANAVAVGCVIRDRRLGCRFGWAGAFLGFVAADVLFGRTLSLAAFFGSANLIGSMVAAAVLGRLDAEDLALRRAHSVPRIVACLVPGCFAAALVGALLVTVEFKGSALQALLTWPASELVNYLVVLPAVLTFRRGAMTGPRLSPWPVLLLALSCAAAIGLAGPGSIMFPMPALLLCALAYPVPLMAMLTMVLGTGCLMVFGLGVMDIGQDMSVPSMVVSIRVAVAFLVLVPLTIGSVMAMRDDLLRQLQHAAEHDGLTGLINRRTFEMRLHERLATPPPPGTGHALLWLDIDHFKAINDSHGHPAGDAVLQAFATVAQACCAREDVVARIGGEEFVVLARVAGRPEAAALAERLRRRFAARPTPWNDTTIPATVSIGATYLDRTATDLTDIGRRLDEALYRAKREGRDRVEWVTRAADDLRRPARRADTVGLAA